MTPKSADPARTVCLNCGFAAEGDGPDWERVDHPTLGPVARCPECESTNVTTR